MSLTVAQATADYGAACTAAKHHQRYGDFGDHVDECDPAKSDQFVDPSLFFQLNVCQPSNVNVCLRLSTLVDDFEFRRDFNVSQDAFLHTVERRKQD